MRWKALLAIIGPWECLDAFFAHQKRFPLFVSFKYPWRNWELDQWKMSVAEKTQMSIDRSSIEIFNLKFSKIISTQFK